MGQAMNAPKVNHRGFDPHSGELKYTIGDRLYEAQGVSPFQNKKLLLLIKHGKNHEAIEYMKPFDPKPVGTFAQACERIAERILVGSLMEHLRQDLSTVDNRAPETWAQREREIQQNSVRKDSSFFLDGAWKAFRFNFGGFSIYAVDRDWVNVNLMCDFGIGGHGYVHEVIPHDEIWVSRTKQDGEEMTKDEFLSTALHEVVEHEKMKYGMSYFDAHRAATMFEIDFGLIEVPL